MSGGLRTSVKGYLNEKRLALSGEIDTVHEMNETINHNFTALQAAADSVDKKKPQEKSIVSTSYGVGIFDGSTPCSPMLTSPPKSIDSYGTTIRAESSPPQDGTWAYICIINLTVFLQSDITKFLICTAFVIYLKVQCARLQVTLDLAD